MYSTHLHFHFIASSIITLFAFAVLEFFLFFFFTTLCPPVKWVKTNHSVSPLRDLRKEHGQKSDHRSGVFARYFPVQIAKRRIPSRTDVLCFIVFFYRISLVMAFIWSRGIATVIWRIFTEIMNLEIYLTFSLNKDFLP